MSKLKRLQTKMAPPLHERIADSVLKLMAKGLSEEAAVECVKMSQEARREDSKSDLIDRGMEIFHSYLNRVTNADDLGDDKAPPIYSPVPVYSKQEAEL